LFNAPSISSRVLSQLAAFSTSSASAFQKAWNALMVFSPDWQLMKHDALKETLLTEHAFNQGRELGE